MPAIVEEVVDNFMNTKKVFFFTSVSSVSFVDYFHTIR